MAAPAGSRLGDLGIKEMVTPTGLEPVTSRLGISRSILMSYGAIYPLFIAGFSLLSKSQKDVLEDVL